MRIKRFNYHGFDHEKVKKLYTCSRYLGDMVIGDEYEPTAFYHAPAYDASKGHKEFFLILTLPPGHPQGHPEKRAGIVRGRTREEATKLLTNVPGLWCLHCDVVVYSSYRHDCSACACKDKQRSVAIDGGTAYQRVLHGSESRFRNVRIDLINRKVRWSKKGNP